MLELKKLREILEKVQSKFSQPVSLPCSSLPLSSPRSFPPPPPLPPLLTFTPLPPAHLPPIASDNILKSTISVIPPPPPLPPVFLQSSGSSVQPTTPNSSRSKKCRTPTRKCSTPLLNRPSITVEDLLKVTLKKAPQSIKVLNQNFARDSSYSTDEKRDILFCPILCFRITDETLCQVRGVLLYLWRCYEMCN